MSIWEHGPLRGLIKTIPATSFVAFIIVMCCFYIVMDIIIRHGDDATTRTQVLTMVSSLLSLVGGFYFTNQIREALKDKNQSTSINAEQDKE